MLASFECRSDADHERLWALVEKLPQRAPEWQAAMEALHRYREEKLFGKALPPPPPTSGEMIEEIDFALIRVGELDQALGNPEADTQEAIRRAHDALGGVSQASRAYGEQEAEELHKLAAASLADLDPDAYVARAQALLADLLIDVSRRREERLRRVRRITRRAVLETITWVPGVNARMRNAEDALRVGFSRLGRRVPPPAIRLRCPVRRMRATRPRRTAARRAAGLRSGQDPGDDGGEPPPAGAPPRAADGCRHVGGRR